MNSNPSSASVNPAKVHVRGAFLPGRWYNSGHEHRRGAGRCPRIPSLPSTSLKLRCTWPATGIPLSTSKRTWPRLDGMAHEARAYLRGPLEAQVAGLCRYLFHEMGFRGNEQDYYDPANSYLHLVLDRRKGNPISLSAVAMAVGARAGLELQGVGLPGHFVVKAVGAESELIFDPFHGGRRLHSSDCELLVQQVTGKPFEATPATLTGIPLALMVQRMLVNLKGIYLGRNEFPGRSRCCSVCPARPGRRPRAARPRHLPPGAWRNRARPSTTSALYLDQARKLTTPRRCAAWYSTPAVSWPSGTDADADAGRSPAPRSPELSPPSSRGRWARWTRPRSFAAFFEENAAAPIHSDDEVRETAANCFATAVSSRPAAASRRRSIYSRPFARSS